MSINVRRLVNVSIAVAANFPRRAGFGTLLFLTTEAGVLAAPEITRTYNDIDGVTEDWPAGSEVVKAATSYFSQVPRPTVFKVGLCSGVPTTDGTMMPDGTMMLMSEDGVFMGSGVHNPANRQLAAYIAGPPPQSLADFLSSLNGPNTDGYGMNININGVRDNVLIPRDRFNAADFNSWDDVADWLNVNVPAEISNNPVSFAWTGDRMVCFSTELDNLPDSNNPAFANSGFIDSIVIEEFSSSNPVRLDTLLGFSVGSFGNPAPLTQAITADGGVTTTSIVVGGDFLNSGISGDITYYANDVAVVVNIDIPADATPEQIVEELELKLTGSSVAFDGFGYRVSLDGLTGFQQGDVTTALGLSFEGGATLVVPVGSGIVPTLPGTGPTPTVLWPNNSNFFQLVQAWDPIQATTVDNTEDGSYYFELESDADDDSSYGAGVYNNEFDLPSSNSAFFVGSNAFAFYNSRVYHNGSPIAFAEYASGDRLGIRVVMEAGQATFTAYVNGVAVEDATDIVAANTGSHTPTIASASAGITGHFSADTIMFLPADSVPWDDQLNSEVELEEEEEGGMEPSVPPSVPSSNMPSSIVDCLTEINNFDDDWYGLVLHKDLRADEDQIVEVARWIEARVKVFGYTTNSDDVISSTVTDDIASRLKQGNFRRTMTTYSSTPEEYPSASILARAFSVNFNQPNSTLTLMFKQGPGITVEKLSGNARNVLDSKCANAFNCVGQKNIYDNSRMGNGSFFDEVHGIDWLQNAIETQVCGFLASRTTKTPYSNAGVAAIELQVMSVLDEAAANGLIAPGVTVAGDFLDTGYRINTIPVEDINQSDVDRRHYPGLSFVVLGAGAIHTVEINGTFER